MYFALVTFAICPSVAPPLIFVNSLLGLWQEGGIEAVDTTQDKNQNGANSCKNITAKITNNLPSFRGTLDCATHPSFWPLGPLTIRGPHIYGIASPSMSSEEFYTGDKNLLVIPGPNLVKLSAG